MDCQNWETVTIKRKGPRRATGMPGTKPPVSAGAALARRLEDDDAPKITKSLSSESRAEIVQRRVLAGKTQAQLNTECAFPVNTIRDIESGKLCPTPAQLNVLNRVLHAALKYS